MSRIRSLPQSFRFAFGGIKEAVKNEPNFRIHITFAVAALFAAFVLGCTTYEWLLLLFTIAFVLILELFNTSMESIVNLVSPEIRPQAKIAKDVSAAAVLLGAFISVVVGIVLFLPKILAL
jgi:undecaprenol kinase